MSQNGQLKQRVFSAKPASFHQTLLRPISSTPSQTFSRKELIQNIYTIQSQAMLRSGSAKAMSTALEKSKRIVVKQSRKKEELEDEILKLKKTINELHDELNQQKGKTESMRKKGNKLSKILTIEFQNQSHWNSSALSSHLVTGIKNTYDCLKEKYQILEQDHSQLLKRHNITKELEYITYIDILERENKNLSSRLAKISSTTTQQEAFNYIIADLEANCNGIAEKYQQLEAKYKMCSQTLKDRNTKITFLQKIIIEKDNSSHSLQRQAKKWHQECLTLRQINENLQQNVKEQFQTHEKYIRNLEGKLKEEEDFYQKIISEELKSKQGKISQMERENIYLKDIVNELRKTNSELNKMLQENRGKASIKNELQLPQLKKETIPPPLTFKSNTNQPEINYIGQHYKTVIQKSNGNQPFSGLFANGKRIPQKADIKYHEHAQKKRKIAIQQVNQLAELLRLKLINRNFAFSRVKSLFEVDPNNRKGQWEQEYITMRQVNQILTFPPFSLTQTQAQLLARYLIEDVQTEFVYCDDYNENTREIVKSILKALLKEYPLCMPNSHLESDVKKFMQNYEVNLKSALAKIEPQGLISKRKFVQTLNNLGMECSEQVQDVLLRRMAEKATNINELNYRALLN